MSDDEATYDGTWTSQLLVWKVGRKLLRTSVD